MSHCLPRGIRVALLLLTLVGATTLFDLSRTTATSTTSYYVDCDDGDDDADGRSPLSAWASIDRANEAALSPGDSLLLKRGCAWSDTLRADWNGTAEQPILISAYGSGDRPTIVNAPSTNVKISGSYQIIEHLRTEHTDDAYDWRDHDCLDQPVGWKIGYSFIDGAHDNTLRYSQAARHAAGVNLARGASNNHIVHNLIVDNHGLWKARPGANLGGTGIVLQGRGNEVAWNTFRDNRSVCDVDAGGNPVEGFASISIELYDATDSNIHHNQSYGDRVFSELGSGDAVSSGNRFAYNLHATDAELARFIISRGAGEPYGPVWETSLYNNVAYHLGAGSEGIICLTCSPGVLAMSNNIIVTTWKALYVNSGSSVSESHNLYWPTGGVLPQEHFVQNVSLDPTSGIVDPAFVDPGTLDFHLRPASPAINRGSSVSIDAGYRLDLDQQAVPQESSVDIGIDETRPVSLRIASEIRPFRDGTPYRQEIAPAVRFD